MINQITGDVYTDDELKTMLQSVENMSTIFRQIDKQLHWALRGGPPHKVRASVTLARSALTRLRDLMMPEFEHVAAAARAELAGKELSEHHG